MSLAVDPPDAAAGVPVATAIVVVGYVGGGDTFEYDTLALDVDGDHAVVGAQPSRPAFAARLVKTATRFRLEVRPRRPFLYRVKVDLAVAVDVKNGGSTTPATLAATFTTAPRPEAPAVARLRRALDAPFRLAGLPALGLVHHHARALLGGDAAGDGGFWLRAARCVRRSELWPVARVADLLDGALDGAAEVLDGLRGPDAAVPDPTAALALVELAWEPCLRELAHVGVGDGVLGVLRRSFAASHPWERLAAVCALLLVAQSAGARVDAGAIAHARAQGLL